MSSQHPKDDYEDVLTTHTYDGIQEYDNPMPLWWKAVFVLTVIWAVVYVIGMETGSLPTYEEDLAGEQAVMDLIRKDQAVAAPEVGDASILAALKDPDTVAQGQKVYAANCGACHGDKGQGMIGPNLADKYWIHGGSPLEVYKVIVDGVAAKGMPPWGQVLGPQDQTAVAAFVLSLKGTEPSNPKAPQGDEVP